MRNERLAADVLRNDLRLGDLLFQDIDGGPLCDAIRRVTRGWQDCSFVHVGMVTNATPDAGSLIEAHDDGVVETPLDAFISRAATRHGEPAVAIGRLTSTWRYLIPRAIAHARALLGRPYDDTFELGNGRYYCAELVHEAFKIANRGESLFTAAPMTFNDPATGRAHPAWIEHFAELGLSIPEGAPGINAAAISCSPVLEMRAWNAARTPTADAS